MTTPPLKDREPTILAGLLLALLPAVFGFTEAFGIWDPSPGQIAAIMGLFVAVGAVVIYVLRGIVWSPASVDRLTRPDDPPH